MRSTVAIGPGSIAISRGYLSVCTVYMIFAYLGQAAIEEGGLDGRVPVLLPEAIGRRILRIDHCDGDKLGRAGSS